MLSSKPKMIIIAVTILLVGAAAGFMGGFYAYRIYPRILSLREAALEQAELNQEVRAGCVVSVGPSTLVIRVSKGAADIGKSLALSETPDTTVQIGSAALNRLGVLTDLTRYYETGDAVDVLTKDDHLLAAVFRPLRPGEQVAQVLQQAPFANQAVATMEAAAPQTPSRAPTSKNK